jgi:hypothetical protein
LVSSVLVRTLEKVRMKYPPLPKHPKPIVIK